MKMPPSPLLSAKSANSLAETPVTVCYLLSVNGPGLAESSSPCSPSFGVHTGFVTPNKEINIEIQSGSDRKIDLYLYLPKAGVSCGTDTVASSISPKRMFWMGGESGVEVSGDEVTVNLTAKFPGLHKSLYKTKNYPESCIAQDTPDTTESVVRYDHGFLHGETYSAKTNWNRSLSSKKLEGSIYSLKESVK